MQTEFGIDNIVYGLKGKKDMKAKVRHFSNARTIQGIRKIPGGKVREK